MHLSRAPLPRLDSRHPHAASRQRTRTAGPPRSRELSSRARASSPRVPRQPTTNPVQKLFQKLATRASRMAYRALLHDPSRGHIRSGGEVCSRRKLQTPFVGCDRLHWLPKATDHTVRKYPRSIRNGKASISTDVAPPRDQLDGAADMAWQGRMARRRRQGDGQGDSLLVPNKWCRISSIL